MCYPPSLLYRQVFKTTPVRSTIDPVASILSHSTNRLTRSSLKAEVERDSKVLSRFENLKVVVSPVLATPTGRSNGSLATKRSHRLPSRKSQSGKEISNYSGVMVNIKQDEGTKYKFSPPQPVTMVTPTKITQSNSSAKNEFIFSPPLLRSVTRGNKMPDTRTPLMLDDIKSVHGDAVHVIDL